MISLSVDKVNMDFDCYVKDDAEAAKRVIRHIKNLKKKIFEEDIISLARKVILSAMAEKGCSEQDILDIILIEFPGFNPEKLHGLLSELVEQRDCLPEKLEGNENAERTSDLVESTEYDDLEPDAPSNVECSDDKQLEVTQVAKDADVENPSQVKTDVSDKGNDTDTCLIQPEHWVRNKKYICDITGLGIRGKHADRATCGYYGMISLSEEKEKNESSPDTPRWAWYFFGGRECQQEFSVSENDITQGRFRVLRLHAR